MWSTQLFQSISVVFLQRIFISISTSVTNCKLVFHCRLYIPLRVGIRMVVIVSIVIFLVCLVISSILILFKVMLLYCGILKVLFVLILFLDDSVEMKIKKLLISWEKLEACTCVNQLKPIKLNHFIIFFYIILEVRWLYLILHTQTLSLRVDRRFSSIWIWDEINRILLVLLILIIILTWSLMAYYWWGSGYRDTINTILWMRLHQLELTITIYSWLDIIRLHLVSHLFIILL